MLEHKNLRVVSSEIFVILSNHLLPDVYVLYATTVPPETSAKKGTILVPLLLVTWKCRWAPSPPFSGQTKPIFPLFPIKVPRAT